MLIHFVLSLAFLFARSLLRPVINRYCLLFVWGLCFVPLFWSDNKSDVYGGLFVFKWVILWVDCALLGYIIKLEFDGPVAIRWLLILSLCYLTVEATAGFYELWTGSYLVDVDSEAESVFEHKLVRSEQLEGVIRVRGLQRDVFDFSNLMGVGVLMSGIVVVYSSALLSRVVCLVLGLCYAYMLVYGSGRSAVLGSAGALLVLVGLNHRRKRALWAKALIITAFSLGFLVLFLGIGQLANNVSKALFPEFYILDSQSSYMRDDVWLGIWDKLNANSDISLLGAPVAKLFDDRISPFLESVDNIFLWTVYHSGLVGLSLWIVFIWQFLSETLAGSIKREFTLFSSFMVFLLLEGCVRESFFFPSSLCFFFTSGVLTAASLQSQKEEVIAEERPVRPFFTSLGGDCARVLEE